MDQYSLQLPTKILSISVFQKVNPDHMVHLLADLQEMINHLANALDSTNPRSEINFVHETLPPVKLELSPELASYIRANLEVSILTSGEFHTVSPSNVWNMEKHYLFKSDNAQFNSHTLLTAYIVDEASRKLKQNRITDFLVEADNYVQAGGEHGVELENPVDGSSIQALIANDALCMYVPKKPPVLNPQKTMRNPFSKESDFARNALLVVHPDILMAKAISEMAAELQHIYQLQKVCNRYKCQIIDIDAAGQIHHYQ